MERPAVPALAAAAAMSGRRVSVGPLAAADEPAWDRLVTRHGSAFHAAGVLRCVESAWPAELEPRHVVVRSGEEIVGAVPAYLVRSCPRLDYYRRAVPGAELADRILLSHALAGWYGYPVGRDEDARTAAVAAFVEAAETEGAVAMFAGIDGRDGDLVQLVRSAGFTVRRFHTLMVRPITAADANDPTAALPGRWRKVIRNQLSQARRAGTVARLATRDDTTAVVELITGVLHRQGTPVEVLHPDFVTALLGAGERRLEAVVATDPHGRPVAAQINARWQRGFVNWLGGNDAAVRNVYRPAHFLLEWCVRRAASLGASESQAGRDPFEVKRHHGFRPVPLLAAAYAVDPARRARSARWLDALERRHLARYSRALGFAGPGALARASRPTRAARAGAES